MSLIVRPNFRVALNIGEYKKYFFQFQKYSQNQADYILTTIIFGTKMWALS
jgi:hypothetical protein